MKEENKVVLNETDITKDPVIIENESLFKGVWEHLKTRKKYNRVCLLLEEKKEDISRLNMKINTMENQHETQKEEWEEKLKKLTKENIKLKEEIATLREGGKKNVSNTKTRSVKVSRKKQDNK
jgi:hypothetical protein